MKPIQPYLVKILVFFLLSILLQSCVEKSGSWKNGQIKAGKRDDFHALNDDAFKFLKANDAQGLHALMSKELIDNSYMNRQVELISNQLNHHTFSLMDEYYVVNKYIDRDTIKAATNGINSYDLEYGGTPREMYMAFFIPKDSQNKYLISLIYGKYDYGWKLSDLDLAPDTISGKTAPELFALAKQEYQKKHLIDALNTTALALSCDRPNELWEYKYDIGVNAFYTQLVAEANNTYKFPFTIQQVSTKPRIIRVYNETTDKGVFPMIYYLSKIKLSDTVAIKNENNQISAVIGKVMPGIDVDNPYIMFSAFNELPTGKKSVDHFDMTAKMK